MVRVLVALAVLAFAPAGSVASAHDSHPVMTRLGHGLGRGLHRLGHGLRHLGHDLSHSHHHRR